MGVNILVYISLIASGIALALGIYATIASGQMRALRKLFGHHKPDNLDEVVEQIVNSITQLDSHARQTEIDLEKISNQLNTATQHVGIIRYNSNGDDGGNLSFSAAFLDAHQSGIVLTSLHGRQNNRIYAKAIIRGASESTLSEEEREALMNALTHENLELQTKKSNKNSKS